MSVLNAENLKKSYGDLCAVDGVSLSVKAGECLAVVGPNGAGKTTTVEMLEGLVDPDEGSITIFGKDLRKHRAEILQKVGVVLQETRLYKKLTVKETLDLFGSFYRHHLPTSEVIRLLALEEKTNVRLEALSGGQQQRVYLGCALINEPHLLFLDEPTTGLDPQARRALWDIVDARKKAGCAVLLTTHYMDEAEQFADRVAIIDRGQIITEGGPVELIEKHCGTEIVQVRSGTLDDVFIKLTGRSIRNA